MIWAFRTSQGSTPRHHFHHFDDNVRLFLVRRPGAQDRAKHAILTTSTPFAPTPQRSSAPVLPSQNLFRKREFPVIAETVFHFLSKTTCNIQSHCMIANISKVATVGAVHAAPASLSKSKDCFVSLAVLKLLLGRAGGMAPTIGRGVLGALR